MNAFMQTFNILFGSVAAISTLYILYYAIAGRIKKHTTPKYSSNLGRFAILIPGYKEDNVILETAKAVLKHNYPKENMEVFVLADHFNKSTLLSLKNLGATVLEFNFEKSTKATSINKSLQMIPSSFDYILVLDADNILEHNALHYFNAYLNQGYRAVQGQRTAKNKNTAFALLDAANEAINNHIFRVGHQAAGLPSALIGSGMAFDFNLYKELMIGLDAVTGEDKELEMRLLQNKIAIAYAPEAVILDEKVQQSAVFAKQRQRWLATQMHQIQTHANQFSSALKTKNLPLLNKIVQAFVLPRTLLLAAQSFILLLNLFWGNHVWMAISGGLLFATVYSLGISLPKAYYTTATLKALIHMPIGLYYMIKGLTGLRAGKKEFIHTPHGIV